MWGKSPCEGQKSLFWNVLNSVVLANKFNDDFPNAPLYVPDSAELRAVAMKDGIAWTKESKERAMLCFVAEAAGMQIVLHMPELVGRKELLVIIATVHQMEAVYVSVHPVKPINLSSLMALMHPIRSRSTPSRSPMRRAPGRAGSQLGGARKNNVPTKSEKWIFFLPGYIGTCYQVFF